MRARVFGSGKFFEMEFMNMKVTEGKAVFYPLFSLRFARLTLLFLGFLLLFISVFSPPRCDQGSVLSGYYNFVMGITGVKSLSSVSVHPCMLALTYSMAIFFAPIAALILGFCRLRVSEFYSISERAGVSKILFILLCVVFVLLPLVMDAPSNEFQWSSQIVFLLYESKAAVVLWGWLSFIVFTIFWFGLIWEVSTIFRKR